MLIKEEKIMDEIKKFNKDFYTISNDGAIEYLSSTIETLKEKIEDNDSNKPLHNEQILFFSKALEMCKAYNKLTKQPVEEVAIKEEKFMSTKEIAVKKVVKNLGFKYEFNLTQINENTFEFETKTGKKARFIVFSTFEQYQRWHKENTEKQKKMFHSWTQYVVQLV